MNGGQSRPEESKENHEKDDDDEEDAGPSQPNKTRISRPRGRKNLVHMTYKTFRPDDGRSMVIPNRQSWPLDFQAHNRTLSRHNKDERRDRMRDGENMISDAHSHVEALEMRIDQMKQKMQAAVKTGAIHDIRTTEARFTDDSRQLVNCVSAATTDNTMTNHYLLRGIATEFKDKR
ncbi:hypothetical protein LZ32DRAFT_610457 [Colletotrichum eremochloae]|nr:hypothetical protein LZ32DRAFT_610457 [Colletotrichum eremochloae]